MTLYGYCFYNKKIGAYTAPVWNQFDKDIAKESQYRAFLMTNKEEEKVFYSENDFYYLGTFDDKSGEFNLNIKPEFLCAFGEAKNGENE